MSSGFGSGCLTFSFKHGEMTARVQFAKCQDLQISLPIAYLLYFGKRLQTKLSSHAPFLASFLSRGS